MGITNERESARADKLRILQHFSFVKGIKRRWLVNNLSVIATVIVLVFALAAVAFSNYFTSSVQFSLQNRAASTTRLINLYMSDSFDSFYRYANNIVNSFSDKDKMEMQVIDQYGRIMFSSTGLSAGFMLISDDVMNTLQTGKASTYVGEDQLTGESIMAVTSPVLFQDGTVIGGVRYVTSTRALDKQLNQLNLILLATAVLLLTFVVMANQFFIRSIVNPVLQINQLAGRIAGGQYGAKLDVAFDDEIGELCTTINNMSAEIARMEKLKNDFISSVSHELRTPLTAIAGWVDTIESDLKDTQTATAGCNIIRQETIRLSQMVEELLDFSRIESGGIKLRTEDFDIRAEVKSALFTYRDMLRQTGLEVQYSEEDYPVIVLGDRHRLKQVFLNIIDNAAKYGADGKALKVSVCCKTGVGTLRIREFGVGIPQDELPFVKEKFFKGSARGRGAGIGLAVCNEIVMLHEGELEVESTYGEGTEIIIKLPARAGESEKADV